MILMLSACWEKSNINSEIMKGVLLHIGGLQWLVYPSYRGNFKLLFICFSAVHIVCFSYQFGSKEVKNRFSLVYIENYVKI